MNQNEPLSSQPKLVFVRERLEVVIGNNPVPLTKSEFGILSFLSDQQGLVCSRRQIIDAVQGEDYPVTERSVDVQMASLRKKLGETGKRIKTVRGKGFCFE
jgi:two-component system phosphate regulon response regulator PhoB